MLARITQRRIASAALLLCALTSSWSPASETLLDSGAYPSLLLEADNSAHVELAAQVPPAPQNTPATGPNVPPPYVPAPAPGPPANPLMITPPAQASPTPDMVPPPQVVRPPAEVAPSAAPELQPASPFLDDSGLDPMPLDEDLPTPEDDARGRVGVRPYGGGHPGDWPWGCGGSPYRTGPGLCDDWRVGCRWHVGVDGIVLSREDTDLDALTAATDEDSAGNPLIDPTTEQFDHAPGGRVSFFSQVSEYVGYQMYAAYEGIEEWNASVVFPKESPMPVVGAGPDSSEQRSLHYRSSLHSGELNFVRVWHSMWQPFCGVRYIKFDDEISDSINQQAPPPLPGPAPAPVTTTDRLNLFDLENNLIGFQIGAGSELWRFNDRLSLEGFFNAGVYYNKIKYTNLMGVFTTQQFADDTATAAVDESRTDFSNVVNNDVSELSEISYVSEASLSGIFRLNRCWALRAGYQVLWISDLHLADDALLDTGVEERDLVFHGWHAGVECRR